MSSNQGGLSSNLAGQTTGPRRYEPISRWVFDRNASFSGGAGGNDQAPSGSSTGSNAQGQSKGDPGAGAGSGSSGPGGSGTNVSSNQSQKQTHWFCTDDLSMLCSVCALDCRWIYHVAFMYSCNKLMTSISFSELTSTEVQHSLNLADFSSSARNMICDDEYLIRRKSALLTTTENNNDLSVLCWSTSIQMQRYYFSLKPRRLYGWFSPFRFCVCAVVGRQFWTGIGRFPDSPRRWCKWYCSSHAVGNMSTLSLLFPSALLLAHRDRTSCEKVISFKSKKEDR